MTERNRAGSKARTGSDAPMSDKSDALAANLLERADQLRREAEQCESLADELLEDAS